MKRLVTWVVVGLLVAVAFSRWRRMNEPAHQVSSGGTERLAARPDQTSQPAGGASGAPRRAEESVDQATEPNSGVEATPAAERKAAELGVDLSEVKGTGSGGRIIVKDVQDAAKER